MIWDSAREDRRFWALRWSLPACGSETVQTLKSYLCRALIPRNQTRLSAVVPVFPLYLFLHVCSADTSVSPLPVSLEQFPTGTALTTPVSRALR